MCGGTPTPPSSPLVLSWLEPGYAQQAIPDADDDGEGDDARGYTTRDEVADLEVALAGLVVFLHYGRHVWEACEGGPESERAVLVSGWEMKSGRGLCR